DIDLAMQAAARAAALALGEVLFVVAAHVGRKAGDVIAPSRQDAADDAVCAVLTQALLPLQNSIVELRNCRSAEFLHSELYGLFNPAVPQFGNSAISIR